jgi:presequence protease
MTKHGQFKLVKKSQIEELRATLYEYKHTCGARVIHLANDDPENVYCLAFRTTPDSEDGVAHILEHTLLCGSEKYPLKDPFFVMTRRSLNTYMNALTAADSTYYPGASQIKQDYFNLFEVYIDAVFHPLLTKESFLQEGWRYALTNPDDIESPLEYKGIVYNEMKGAASSRDNRLWYAMCKLMLPDLTYSYNSGGEAAAIPTLTNKKLKEFHKKYYSPGKCIFYTYGNIPVEDNLDFIEEKALQGVEPCKPLPAMPSQKRFTTPVIERMQYPAASADSKTMVALSWLTVEGNDQEGTLILQLIDSVLNDTDNSPLQKAILDSGLCSQSDTYFDSDMSEVPYMLILRDCEEGSAEKIRDFVLKALEKIAEDGINPEQAEAALHSIELSKMEISGDSGPFGLSLGMHVCAAALNQASPETPLHVYSRLEKMIKKVEDPKFLSGFIKKHLIDNAHLVVLEMSPSTTLLAEEKQAETKRLEAISKTLTKKDREAINKQNEELAAYQKKDITKEEFATLPELKSEHIPKRSINLRLIHHETRGAMAPYFHNTFTNHFVYAQTITDLPALTEEQFMTAELMVNILPELGVGNRSYEENIEHIHKYTGGIESYVSVQSIYGDNGKVHPIFAIRGKALSRNKHHLFSLLRDYNIGARFDEKERIKQQIEEMATSLKSSFVPNSLTYARGLALSGLSLCNHLHEVMHGVRYYQFVIDLAKNIDARLPLLIEEFQMLKEMLFHGHNLDLLVTSDDDDYKEIMENGYYGVDEMPKKSFHPFDTDFVLPKSRSCAATIASPVAFIASAVNVSAAPNLDAAPLHLGAKLMSHRVLHKKIREQGGAYDGGAGYSPLTGNFVMHSYRDPHIQNTLGAFKEAIRMINNQDFDKDHLRAAKMSLIQTLDDPIPPGSRGIVAYNWMHTQRSWEDRQTYRENIMRTTSSCIKSAIEKNLSSFHEDATTVIFAGKTLLDKEKVDLPHLEL